jgi:hypothetical protein
MALSGQALRLRGCLLFSIIALCAPLRAQSTPTLTLKQAAPSTHSAALLPWLDLATSEPLSIAFSHDFSYDPKARDAKFKVVRSDWNLTRVRLALFEGQIDVVARGVIAQTRPTDIRSTVTLKRINITRLLEFMNVPRAREIEAIVSGTLGVEALAGDWKRVDVDLVAHDGTVCVSRVLLHQLLSPAFGGGLEPADVETALNKLFPGEKMIPINGLHIEGNLTGAVLHVSLPLRNEVLNIDLDPNIDAALLWQVWELLQNESLKGIREADWDFEVERTGLAPTAPAAAATPAPER